MRDRMKIMAIIPAYNEEQTISTVIRKTNQHVDDVVVINDGSTDRTAKHAKQSGATVIHVHPNSGKGVALYVGFQIFLNSNADVAITLDGDGQHDPKYIMKFIKRLNSDSELGIILASRFRTSDWQKNMPFIRKVSNLLSRFGLWVLYNGLIIEDPQNGFRLYTKNAIKMLRYSGSRSKIKAGFEEETKILIEARIARVKIGVVSVPSLYFEDRKSKFSGLHDTWKIPAVMVKSFFSTRPWLHRKGVRRKIGSQDGGY